MTLVSAPPRMPPPPRLLPIMYFGVAHVSLAIACAAVALDPRGVAGFFYHSRMLAIVHLVTLGWITASILGSLYIVGPIALRVWLPARAIDYTAFALFTTGVGGMVGHFWLGADNGMAYSAATAAAGILIAGAAIVRRLIGAALPPAITSHIVLAFANVAVAAAAGVLIGFDKVYHFLPGFVLANVFAHAHLAAIGWASMMVVGVGYRLLPMVLPAAMPRGRSLWASAMLLEIGVMGLFVSLLVRSRLTALFGAVLISGFAAFLSHVVWMVRHPRTRPPGLRAPDPAVWHAVAAFGSLIVASTLGLWLAIAESTSASLRIAMVYGVFGLLGFLAQMVVGMEGRLLPIFAWYWAYANTEYKGPVRSPHEMPWRDGQQLVFVLWVFGVPALAGGLAFDAIPFVAGGAWLLFVAVLFDTATVIGIVRHAFASTKRSG
jgi:hypothetical protein